MKLPSWTLRTRSLVGSKITVSVTVESRDASVTEIGIVYGPPPTRNVVLGGDRITCAEPMPALALGAGGAGAGGACGAAGGGWGGCTSGGVAVSGVAGFAI